MLSLDNARIAVVGLGYVGLPLAVAFGKRYDTLGLDLSAPRIEALKGGVDHTLEVAAEDLAAAGRLAYSADPADLAGRNLFIVTVPTPIDEAKRPDLTAIRKASESIGAHLTPGAIVVYESTVYP